MEIVRLVFYPAVGLSLCIIYYELAIAGPLRRRMRHLNCKPPPSDRPWLPLFGIDFLLTRSRNVKCHTWLEYSKHHFLSLSLKTFQLNILDRSIIYTIDPENLKAIHVTQFKSWGLTPSRKQRVVPLIGEGVFTTDGHGWTQSRKLLRPSFERSQMENMLSFLEEHVRDLIRSIPKDGTAVDLQKPFYRFTMNSASQFLLGDSLGAADALEEGFGEAFDRCLSTVGGAGKFQSFASQKDVQYERDRCFVHDAIDRRLDKAFQQPAKAKAQTERHTFLDNLLSGTHNKQQLRSELLNNLMAGRDTSASLLSNTWFELAQQPRVWQRLHQEVQDAFHGHKPSSQHQLQELPYLRAILNESMRMYPQIAENGRMALEDTVLPRGGGADGMSSVFVPKWKIVMWGNYVLQRDPDNFGENADEFKPERWLGEDGRTDLKPGFAYLAFGAGPRQCMGQRFALTQVSYLIVRMVQTFTKIQSTNSDPWRERLNLVLAIEGGCPVALS